MIPFLQNVPYNTVSLRKKNTIHQVATMLATSKNVLFPGHNHLLTTITDDPTLSLSPKCHLFVSILFITILPFRLIYSFQFSILLSGGMV